MTLKVEVSVGELLDKMTILEIKSERIKDPEKLRNIGNELSCLKQAWEESRYNKESVVESVQKLKTINEALWEIEDDIRIKETKQEFDDEFIKLARAVYQTNDQRARVKKEINDLTGSELTEEKSYPDYMK